MRVVLYTPMERFGNFNNDIPQHCVLGNNAINRDNAFVPDGIHCFTAICNLSIYPRNVDLSSSLLDTDLSIIDVYSIYQVDYSIYRVHVDYPRNKSIMIQIPKLFINICAYIECVCYMSRNNG